MSLDLLQCIDTLVNISTLSNDNNRKINYRVICMHACMFVYNNHINKIIVA